MVYQTNLNGEIKQLTDGWYDYGSIQTLGNTNMLIATRHSISHPDDIYLIKPSDKAKKSAVTQITNENKHILDQMQMGKVSQRWVETTDGKKELVWIILPPHFDENKKYPTLLFCEGGPQSPVSQFWSYRWNFQIMAAQGYIVVAPNRRGLPGFGQAWNEEVSGDWTGQCMNDYLSAIDDAAKLPYVDKDRLGCVGASFGGFFIKGAVFNCDLLIQYLINTIGRNLRARNNHENRRKHQEAKNYVHRIRREYDHITKQIQLVGHNRITNQIRAKYINHQRNAVHNQIHHW